jgi:hypothetical protein
VPYFPYFPGDFVDRPLINSASVYSVIPEER